MWLKNPGFSIKFKIEKVERHEYPEHNKGSSDTGYSYSDAEIGPIQGNDSAICLRDDCVSNNLCDLLFLVSVTRYV